MAKGKKKETLALSLTPNATIIEQDGLKIIVPADKGENAIMGIILASQVRAQIQRAMKYWSDTDQTPTPKEIRDLAAAVRDINESCGAIFDTLEMPKPREEREAEKIMETGIDFNSLPKDGDKTNSNEQGPILPAPEGPPKVD